MGSYGSLSFKRKFEKNPGMTKAQMLAEALGYVVLGILAFGLGYGIYIGEISVDYRDHSVLLALAFFGGTVALALLLWLLAGSFKLVIMIVDSRPVRLVFEGCYLRLSRRFLLILGTILLLDGIWFWFVAPDRVESKILFGVACLLMAWLCPDGFSLGRDDPAASRPSASPR
jgi:hypothetical protein